MRSFITILFYEMTVLRLCFPFSMISAAGVFRQRLGLYVIQIPRRWKKKWASEHTKRKAEPSFHALQHFDNSYQHQFGSSWQSIRLGLLSKPMYGALVNNYTLSEDTEAFLANLGAKDFVQPAAVELTMAHGLEETSDLEETSSEEEDAETELELSQEEDSKVSPVDTIPSKEAARWEDKYIITPGYEAQMGHFMSSGTFSRNEPSVAPVPHTDIDVIQQPLSISKHLKCFVFEAGNPDRFPASKIDPQGNFLQYYAMDAASILPVIALDVQPEDLVLDMCAAPGGKTLSIIQTMLAGGVVANDLESSRRRRLTTVLKSYVGYDKSSQHIRVTAEDGCDWGQMEPATYDKVLVDAPCTTDRLSAINNTNSIFAVHRNNERWELPKLQSELLFAAILAVKPGGDVIYSTCSLSHQQNDAVVQNALYRCRTESDAEAAVVDVSVLARHLGHIFKFDDSTKYGELVVPNIKRNFGPTYFCKLHRYA